MLILGTEIIINLLITLKLTFEYEVYSDEGQQRSPTI